MCRRDAQIVEGSFDIPPESVDGALDAARAFLTDLGYEDELRDLTTVFRLFNVIAAGRPDRSIAGLEFEGTILTELEELFERLAPHVRAGSWLEWKGDRGEQWRYDFDGTTLATSPE
jgi:hypothetical protein